MEVDLMGWLEEAIFYALLTMGVAGIYQIAHLLRCLRDEQQHTNTLIASLLEDSEDQRFWVRKIEEHLDQASTNTEG